jgi:hypothetical protein
MNAKRNWLVLGLAGAIGIPYLFSSAGVAGMFSSKSGTSASKPADGVPLGHELSSQTPGTAKTNADATPVVDLPQAIRWDVTTAWILGQWPRVSAGLTELDLHGYRVPLVTGTKIDDLAGSLTYYFNRVQRLERITFHGTTGDARKLVAHLATRFGFLRELTDDAGLYLYRVRDGGKPTSELRIKPAKIVRADMPHTRFEVSLVVQRTEK